MIEVGSKAPDFKLENAAGEKVSLSDFLGKKVVLYFYSKDNTSGCTKQALEYERLKNEFDAKSAVIIGISKDTALTHKKFAEKHGLTFLILSDTEKDVLCEYGVWQEKKMCGKVCMGTVRTTFIIDENGNVEKIFEKVKPETDACTILDYLSLN